LTAPAERNEKQSIVVGVDGSAGSAAALRWALAEARLRGAPLRLVYVYESPQLTIGEGAVVGGPAVGLPSFGSEDVERLRAASETEGRRILEQTLAGVGAEQTEGIQIEQEVVGGSAAPVLLDAGRSAALLVVGSRGRGGFVGLLLGSVSQQCAQHPPCPVVILPPAEEDGSASR
jgi:nucleotide-binding universal stress UspA family protein